MFETKVFLYRLEREGLTRDEFIKRFRTAFFRYLQPKSAHPNLWLIILEIVKNIYDHSGADGIFLAEDEGDVFSFLAFDFGERSFPPFKTLRDETAARGSSKGENGVNQGSGLYFIDASARGMKMELRVDTERGFEYCLRWKNPEWGCAT